MFAVVIKVIVFSAVLTAYVLGDYTCLCNYNVELPIYSKDSSAAQVIGYLYEFDCKAIYAKAAKDDKFTQVQFENKIGFIENGDGIQIQVCQGSVPFEDIVTTTTSRSITSTTTPTTTSTESKTTTSTEASTAGSVTKQMTTSSTQKPNIGVIINIDRNHTIINGGNTSQSTDNTSKTVTAQPITILSTTASTSVHPTTNMLNTFSSNLTSPSQTHLNKTLLPITKNAFSTQLLTVPDSTPLSSSLSSSTPTTSTTASPTTSTTARTSPSTTTITTTTAPKPSCPNGWIMYKSSCYMFQTNHRSQWHEANNDCVSKSSHLAIVENVDEFNFLKQHLDHLIDTHIHDGSDSSAWVSGRDDRHEGHWEWFNGLTNTYKPFTFTHWESDEPDAGGNEHEEDCMTMVGNQGFHWADYSCNEHMFYVCEQSTKGYVSIATQMPPKQVQLAGCPQGWETYQGSCYLFHTDNRLKWKEANSFCVSQQAHLAIIETAGEDQFLKQQSSQRIHENDDDSDSGVWIGGSDDDTEGRWEWIDDYSHKHTLIQGYSNWHKGEPDSGDGEHGEDCMCMIGVKNYEWQDYRCRTHMFFICEKSQMPAAPLVG